MIDLDQAVTDYLAVRRAMGFKLVDVEHRLRAFVAYLHEHQAATITVQDAVAWARLPVEASEAHWGMRLRAVRGFARYLSAIDPAVEIPPVDLLPSRPCRAVPFIYTDEEIAALIAAAGRLALPLRASVYRTLIGLLAVTGMRISEAINLDDSDLDLDHGVLVVSDSKFGKTRELPLHPSTIEALGAYLTNRRRLCPTPVAPALFLTMAGTRLHYCGVQVTFRQLVQDAGVIARSERCRPRLHDFRHTFAARTLEECYRDGLDASARLPLLCTYLGHANPAATYWYLTGTPELFETIAQRLERDLEAWA